MAFEQACGHGHCVMDLCEKVFRGSHGQVLAGRFMAMGNSKNRSASGLTSMAYYSQVAC